MKRNCPLSIGGTGVCVTDTQGRVREYSQTNQYFVGFSLVFPMVKVRDVHGNSIVATYFTEGKVNTITDSVGRTVTFNYTPGSACAPGPGCLQYIEARLGGESRRVTYSYRTVTPGEASGAGKFTLPGPRAFLERATPAVGLGYSYEYRFSDFIVGNQFALKQITNPFGAKSVIEYRKEDVFTGSTTVPMAFVSKRTVTGPNLPAAEWRYDASHPANSEFATVTVTRPDTQVETYNFYGFGAAAVYGQSGRVWRVGLQASVDRGGLESETWEWEPGEVVAVANYSSPSYTSSCPAWAWDTQVRNPYVRRRVLTRNASRYETLVSQVDAYGQPKEVVETGEAQRTSNTKIRERRFVYDSRVATNQLVGRVASETSCLGAGCLSRCPSGCATTARTFGGLNGLPDAETVNGVTTQFAYHPDGALRTVTDANGKVMTVTYVNGQPTGFAFGPSLALSREYEWDGQVHSVTSARGFTTTHLYDAAGRLVGVVPPAGNDATSIAYDDVTGRIVTETRGVGATALVTTKTFDGLGRDIESTNNLGEKQTVEFDAMGRRVFASIPFLLGEAELGVKTEFDGLGRPTKVTQRYVATGHRPLVGACATPNACETTHAFDTNHCLTTTTARASNDTVSTKTCFEAFGDIGGERVESIVDANLGRWAYQYDVANNLVSFGAAMPSGNRRFDFAPTTFFLRRETSAARGVTETTSHDALGQPTTRVDARGVTTKFEYDDALSRLTAVTFPAFAQESSRRTYEGHLLKTVTSAAGGTYTYEYDALDRVRVMTWVFLGRTFTTRYQYNASGCLERMTYPTGTVFVMTCDKAGRPTSIRQEVAGGTQPLVTNATYNALGRTKTATYGNGKVVTTSFVNGRVRSISAPNVVDMTYEYDGADNVTSVLDGQNPANNAKPITYDKLDRLRTVVLPGGTYGFDYDAMGNRLVAEVPGQAKTTYRYDATTGRLEASNGPGAPALMALSWSASERLATSSDGATYVYDAYGRRVRKTQPSASLDVISHYDSSGHLLAETDANGLRIREYVYLQGQLVATQGCLRGFSVTCQERAWLYTDIVGSVVARSDAAGAVTRFDNRPWGMAAPDEEPRRFNGRWYDSGIDAYDFGAREYAPVLARFLSADTKWKPLNPAFANSYAYVFNNPYKYIDPSGNEPITVGTILLMGAIGAVVGGVTTAAHSYAMTGEVNWRAVAQNSAWGFVGGVVSAVAVTGILGTFAAGGGGWDFGDCQWRDRSGCCGGGG
jgi:RHS repeat-associated protein